MALVRTTLDSRAKAEALARAVVEAGRAACVHLAPIRSIYRWKGKVEDEEEWLVEARVPADLAGPLWDFILGRHPYEVPLVEVVGPTQVPAPYARWARGEVRKD